MSRIERKSLSLYLLFFTGILFLSGCKSDDTPNDEMPAESWEEFSALPSTFRTHHSYAFGLNGVGYIVGGQSVSGPRNEFYRYDPAQDTWTQLDDYPGPPRGYGIGDEANGKAYYGFGYEGEDYLRDLWVFDPATSSWDELAECPCSPRIHPAFVYSNGKIYVGMGEDENDNDLNDWWEYNISTDSWTQKRSIPASARHHPYQFAIGDYVYAGMGHHAMSIYNDWYRYDPATDTWDRMADLPDQGRVAGNQFTHKGLGYVISGEGAMHTAMSSGEFWGYDPSQNVWEQLLSHPGSSRWAPSTFIIDDELYIINGESDGVYAGTAYKFQLD